MPEETSALDDAAARRRRFSADVLRLYTEAAALHKQVWKIWDYQQLAADEIRALILQLNRLPDLAALAENIQQQSEMLIDCAYAYRRRPEHVETLEVRTS
ncbi:MAG: hypothetical protein WD738_00470 [Pirellulales bacterium]